MVRLGWMGLVGLGWIGWASLGGLDLVGWVGLGWVVGLGFGLGCLRWVGWMCSIVFDLLAVQLIPMYSVCVQ